MTLVLYAAKRALDILSPELYDHNVMCLGLMRGWMKIATFPVILQSKIWEAWISFATLFGYNRHVRHFRDRQFDATFNPTSMPQGWCGRIFELRMGCSGISRSLQGVDRRPAVAGCCHIWKPLRCEYGSVPSRSDMRASNKWCWNSCVPVQASIATLTMSFLSSKTIWGKESSRMFQRYSEGLDNT